MNRPSGGRQKHVTGEGKGIGRRGSGLGTGPVGRRQGYSGRPTSPGGSVNGGGSGSGVTRSGLGGSKLIIIILIAVFIFGGGGGLLSNLFGGSSGGSGLLSGGSAMSMFSSLIGGSGSDAGAISSVSSGWVMTDTTGKLKTSVAEGARDKYTTILGGGRDVVTIMVYMCGTDLESKSGMASNDLKEMAAATIGKNVNLLVYTGGCRQWKIDSISNKVNQVYRIADGKMYCLVNDDGSDSLVKPATLTRFIKYCVKNYPANRYDLIFWDHGGGSVSGYGYDENNRSAGSMTLKGINDALSAAGVKFDFIGFDACLMATLENALMLEKYADYMIASEETEPGVGWYYTDWLTVLSKNTSIDTPTLGKQIVDDFIAYCNRYCAGQKTTLSVVDLAEVGATVPEKLNGFASAATELLKNDSYKTVSDARSSAREFAVSSRIDQVDLVHFAHNVGTPEAKELVNTLLGAVKYNRTSSAITNAYGLSIYFPYRKAGTVDKAVATYEAIGMDDDYSRCIKQFASLEVSGQAVAGGGSSPVESILGTGSPSSLLSGGGVGDLLGSLLSGGSDLLGSLTGGSSGFFGRDIDLEASADYLTETQFDASKLVWTKADGGYVMELPEKQWKLVHDLQLSVLYDDGEGYIDLGLDSLYDFTEDGMLIGEFDGTWLAIDKQPVAFYCIDSMSDGSTVTGRVPVMLNGDRAELILVFNDENPDGFIAGARYVYSEDGSEPVAKTAELNEGDVIDFVCDFYSYEGKFIDSYKFGDPMTYTGNHEISNVYLPEPENANAVYLFTDIYANEFWTPVIPAK